MSVRDDYSSAYNAASSLGKAETTLFTLTIVLNLAATITPNNIPFYLNIVIAISAFTYSAIYMTTTSMCGTKLRTGDEKAPLKMLSVLN